MISPDRNGILFLRHGKAAAEKDIVDSGKQLLKKIEEWMPDDRSKIITENLDKE